MDGSRVLYLSKYLEGILRRGVFEGGRRVGFVVFRNFPLWMMLYGRFVAINLVARLFCGWFDCEKWRRTFFCAVQAVHTGTW